MLAVFASGILVGEAFVDLKKAHASEAATPARYQHVLRAVFSTPWVILHDYMQLVSDVLVRHMAGFTISASDLERIRASPCCRCTE